MLARSNCRDDGEPLSTRLLYPLMEDLRTFVSSGYDVRSLVSPLHEL